MYRIFLEYLDVSRTSLIFYKMSFDCVENLSIIKIGGGRMVTTSLTTLSILCDGIVTLLAEFNGVWWITEVFTAGGGGPRKFGSRICDERGNGGNRWSSLLSMLMVDSQSIGASPNRRAFAGHQKIRSNIQPSLYCEKIQAPNFCSTGHNLTFLQSPEEITFLRSVWIWSAEFLYRFSIQGQIDTPGNSAYSLHEFWSKVSLP